MSQVNVDFATRMIAASESGQHSPLTVSEENQLAYAWLCLDMLRGLVADGEHDAAIGYLADPAGMADAFKALYREGS